MACPYFYPVESCRGSATLPLGGWWKGVCHSASGAPEAESGTPGGSPRDSNCDPLCDPLCNLGYARGACARFPAGEGPDAVRFTISSHSGDAIRIYYVMEHDHFPFTHGRLDYSPAAGAFLAPPGMVTLERQARAYVESYLRQLKEA